MRNILALLFLLTTTFAYTQKQGDFWYFGEGAGMDFSAGSPTTFAGGLIFGYPATPDEFIYGEGSAIISDSSGQLLFYSNGETVWNANSAVMTNGDGLSGMYSSTHAAFIVPAPGSDSLFYLFTTDGLERNLTNGLRYSVVDMCLSNQLGDVAPGQKNIPLLDQSTEKITAVNHPNGTDIWLVAHQHNTADFYSFLITENGITDTVVTTIGSVHSGTGAFSAIGQMKTSPDGSRIALVFSNTIPAVAEVFDFDGTTGQLSNPIGLTTIGNEYGVEFSPDGSKLYVTSIGGIHQFDLAAGSTAAINASKTQLTSWASLPSGMQLGPDGKIYIAKASKYVSAIQDPNVAGVGCNLVDSALNFDSVTVNVTFPSFIHGYQYRNTVVKCTPDPPPPSGLAEEISSSVALNSFVQGGQLYVWLKGDQRQLESIRLYQLNGQLVGEMANNLEPILKLDVATLAGGLYLLEAYGTDGQGYAKKVVISR